MSWLSALVSECLTSEWCCMTILLSILEGHKNNDVDVFTNAMSVSVLSLDNRRWSWSKHHSCRTVMLTSIATWDRTRQLSKNKLVTIANSMREEYNVELWYFVHVKGYGCIMYRWCTLKQLFCSGLRPKDSTQLIVMHHSHTDTFSHVHHVTHCTLSCTEQYQAVDVVLHIMYIAHDVC